MIVNIDIKKAYKCGQDYSMFITFDFNADVLNVVRGFQDRWWHADTKEWEVPAKEFPKLIDKLDWCEFDITGEIVELTRDEITSVDGFEFKTTPFKHQEESFLYGLNNNRFLLADSMGLGKTKQIIDIAVAKKLQCGYKHCLIVCGVNGLKWNWLEEVKTHSNEEAHILGQRIKSGKITIGSTKDKFTDLCVLPDAYFLITNVETMRNKEIQEKLNELCTHGIIGMVALDEAHKIKDSTSQQGKGFLKSCVSEVRIAMTGTPVMNNPLDCYMIMKWLGYENHSFYAFRNHYCHMGGYGGYQIVGYKNLQELQEKLNSFMLRRKKEDVLDLPEKTYINEYVEMSTKQKKIYDEVTSEIRENIDSIAISPNPLAQLIRMRQATGYPGILSTVVTDSAKLDRMEELIQESIENDKKVIVFSNWTQILNEVQRRLTGYKPAIITGDTKDNDRQEMVRKFQEDDRCKVIIGSLGAMGTGLTLTAGTVVIFLDHPWNRALYDQAVDRCHRIGQSENITVYNLLCKDTIDERIWKLVEEKGEMADAMIDGTAVGNKLELLNYLVN